MGREIRRVPPDWEHPRDAQGHHEALYDEDYVTASLAWLAKLRAWESGDDPDRAGEESDVGRRVFYWEWDGGPPDRAHYRHRRWTPEEATAYQVYENVSEGTPVSPVFPDEAALLAWLLAQGHSDRAARAFIKGGYAPSMMFSPATGLVMGIDTLDR